MNKIVTFTFCENFIDKLTGFVEDNFVRPNKDLSRVAIVFGGKRPALFFNRALARRIGRDFHPPQYFTIDEFMSYVVSKQESFSATQDLDQCYELYLLAQKSAPHLLKGREEFAKFLPWIREIIQFIDQLDLENIDNSALNNIKANAQIGYDVPQDINELLKSIVVLRNAYHQTLTTKRVYSRGLQYRRAAQVIDKVTFAEFDQILFCNFFYINRCEEMVVKSLYDRNQAILIFQGDERKWPVFKRISKIFAHPIVEGKDVATPQFQLKLHAGFDGHSQVCLVRDILTKIKNPQDTVIVLPNPDTIIPLLAEINTLVSDFNISMGYPLKRSSLYSLFEFIFQAQASRKGDRFYARDYLKVLRHPFVKNLQLTQDPKVTQTLVHKIEEILTGKERSVISGTFFIEPKDIETFEDVYMLTLETLDRLGISSNREELQNILEGIHERFFIRWMGIGNFQQLADALESLLDILVDKSFLKNYPFNLNIAVKLYAIKDELKSAAFSHEHFAQEEMFRILKSKIEGEFIRFTGSPLKGLQVLGLQETRSLNFENVIVLDANEGVLPKLNIYEPLIPRDVMISLNLDRLELEEEIQRYQFMRLISSAKNVHLVYQESRECERSRFVEELIWEEEKRAGKLSVVPLQRAGFQVKVAPQVRRVKKTPAMIETLRHHTFSASSINMYLRNPMEFYYSYVLGLKEQDDLLDEPEARHVGTFVHEMLEAAFHPFLNKGVVIDASFRHKFFEMFEEKFAQTFGKSMKSDSILLKAVIKERLSRFLDNEEENFERQVAKILYLEKHFQGIIPMSCGEIKFHYVVDRIDQMKDGSIMIIDYKTGAIDQMPGSLEQIATLELSRESIRDGVRSFQLPLYFYFLEQEFAGKPMNAALYNLRTLKLQKFIDDPAQVDQSKINEVFLRPLDFIISEILNPQVDFIEDVSLGTAL